MKIERGNVDFFQKNIYKSRGVAALPGHLAMCEAVETNLSLFEYFNY